jgi:cytochrome bd-type quinol oxidase subunit 2
MIAVHRFVILGEVTTSYVLEPNQRVFRAFFGWLLALSVIGLFAVMLFAPNALPASLSLAIVLIVMVLMIVVTLRLSILFPAIAVETPGATARNAWADSKQHTFSIFLIFLLAIVPLVIGALFVLFPFVLGDDGQGAALGLPAMIIMSVVQMFATILCVAIASRLYQALADRLLRAT